MRERRCTEVVGWSWPGTGPDRAPTKAAPRGVLRSPCPWPTLCPQDESQGPSERRGSLCATVMPAPVASSSLVWGIRSDDGASGRRWRRREHPTWPGPSSRRQYTTSALSINALSDERSRYELSNCTISPTRSRHALNQRSTIAVTLMPRTFGEYGRPRVQG